MKAILTSLVILTSHLLAAKEVTRDTAFEKISTIILKPNTKVQIADSICVQIYESGKVSDIPTFTKLKREDNGEYIVSIFNRQKITPFRLSFTYGENTVVTEFFYAAKRDKVKFIFDVLHPDNISKMNISFKFEGNTATKYNICHLINKNKKKLLITGNGFIRANFGIENNPFKIKGTLTDTNNYNQYTQVLDSLFNIVKIAINVDRKIISESENRIGHEISEFYTYELNNYSYFNFFINQLFWRSTNDTTKRFLADFYLSRIGSLKLQEGKSPLLKYGVNYLFGRVEEIMEELKFESQTWNYSFQKAYNTVKAIRSDELREPLIFKLFEVDGLQRYVSNYDKKDSCLRDAINYIASRELKDQLRNQLVFTRGSDVLEFSFPDINGDLVGLKDLKGKVFMIDFYASGCVGCASFAKKFADEVHPEFANNKNFAVISVCVNASRDVWQREVAKGLYSQKNGIEVFTAGKGFDIPLMKYYNNNSLPFVLLVDKRGKLIARLNGNQDSSLIASLIRGELEIKNDEENF